MPPAACPNCQLVFKNSSSILKHMNHWFLSCHLWFANVPQQSPSHAQCSPEANTSPPSDYFPTAGHVFDSGPGFLGSFRDDEDAESRLRDPYYPFLSKGEWEIAGFLACSGLSMKLIDEFLSLNLVSYSKILSGMVL